MTMSTLQALMAQMSSPVPCANRGQVDKITVIGAGSVGAACLFCLVAKKISQELVLIDKDLSLARDELSDIQNASVYMGQPNLTFSADYSKSRDSRVVIIAAGQYVKPNQEDDLSVLKKNVDIFREIVPEVMAYNPRCVLLVVTKPVDMMTYVAWKLSGLPPHRVLGTGCSLLSARFRNRIASKLGVSTQVIQAYVIGENGARCVPVWSSVSACGIRLRDINPLMGTKDDPEDWDHMFHDILNNMHSIIKTKSFNTWGISASVAKIVSAIVKNTHECLSVSTYIKGCRHGVDKDKDVFLSLPCIIGGSGVSHIVRLDLNLADKDKLQESADKMHKVQVELSID